MRGKPLLLMLPLLLGGCAAKAAYTLMNAQQAVDAAVSAGAETKVPYEYTLAYEYLQKAKEENGYSEYQAVEKLSASAIEYANAAAEKARQMVDENPDESVVPEELERRETTVPTGPKKSTMGDDL